MFVCEKVTFFPHTLDFPNISVKGTRSTNQHHHTAAGTAESLVRFVSQNE